jgi:protein-S-isoprenylcysteine O-methyltransferase Ste14
MVDGPRRTGHPLRGAATGGWNPGTIAKLLLQSIISDVALGALLFASAGTLHWPAVWVFRENSFAAPVVKVRAARHHRVISSGPYAFVRHPMYSGIMLFFAGVPLLLGSWWGVATRAGVRRSLRHSRPHRGARAGRGTA